VDGAVAETGGSWRLSLDPGAFAVGAPDMDGLLAACRAEVLLAAGQHDPMAPPDHLRSLVAEPLVLGGLGHDAHVEDPAALVGIVERLAALAGGVPPGLS
jgi:pimeloyl-ACP methyl ester carboxylesterase